MAIPVPLIESVRPELDTLEEFSGQIRVLTIDSRGAYRQIELELVDGQDAFNGTIQFYDQITTVVIAQLKLLRVAMESGWRVTVRYEDATSHIYFIEIDPERSLFSR